jgi:hypothetical protein
MGLGSGILDPEKTYSGSRIQGSKRHRIPDPDPQHCLGETKMIYNTAANYNPDQDFMLKANPDPGRNE